MYTKENSTNRIRIIALSQIAQLREAAEKNIHAYRPETLTYCEVLYDTLHGLDDTSLFTVVKTIRQAYEEIGFVDEALMADSLVTAMLAAYQKELGEPTVYELRWSRPIRDFFKRRENFLGWPRLALG